MQWLVSGSGALHEEVLNGDEDGVFHMAQLWVNLPAELKMRPPEHHAVPADEVPVLTDLGRGAAIRLFAGRLGGATGPAPMPTPVLIAHVAVEAGGEVTLPIRNGWTTAFTVVAGAVELAGCDALAAGATPMFADDGETITVASAGGGEILLMSGEPIGEPIAMGGGFVMNTREEIHDAFADEAAGRMGTLEASR